MKTRSLLAGLSALAIAGAAYPASLTLDFQATLSSEQHPTYSGEARYYHVSVNPNNPGIGSYAATIPGTNTPDTPYTRAFTEDVVAYSFLGGTNNSVSGKVEELGTNIAWATQDTTFDGFGQGQLKFWDVTDPGADIATSVDPFNAVDDGGGGGYRSFGGATGTVDISGLATGSLYVFYGSFNARPSLSVTLKGAGQSDIVIADAHAAGNNDSANRSEYYVAELDFVTDGVYDTIEFEWLANGVDYSGNGRGAGALLTGTVIPEPGSLALLGLGGLLIARRRRG